MRVDVVYFVILVGVLVLVHELGHFLTAKFFRAKVLRLSLGFGPALVRWKRGETEYVIGALPLGGYVRILGEQADDVVEEADRSRSFPALAWWKRATIILTGPAMNLVFPIALYFVVHFGVTTRPAPIVGHVMEGHPAASLLEPGDRILEIEGSQVATWDDVDLAVRRGGTRTLRISVERRGERKELFLRPTIATVVRPFGLERRVARIGASPLSAAPQIGVSSESTPAAQAHLATFDVIVSIAGHPVTRWHELARVLDRNHGTMLPVTLLRPERESALDGLLSLELFQPRVATLTPAGRGADGLSRAGIEPAGLYVDHVIPGSPEARAGIVRGDRIVSVNGQRLLAFRDLTTAFRDSPERPRDVVWLHRGVERRASFALASRDTVDEAGDHSHRHMLQMRNWQLGALPPQVAATDRIAYAWREATTRTWEAVELTAVLILRVIQGRVSTRAIGGVLTIYDAVAAREDAFDYLALMALVSVNLGVINLLPIPILDGGQFVLVSIETAFRRRLPRRVRQIASLGGLIFLVTLMILAFKNDFERHFGGG